MKAKAGFWSGLFSFLVLFLFHFPGCVHPPEPGTSEGGNRNPDIMSLTVDPMNVQVETSATITVDDTDPDNNRLLIVGVL